MEKEIVNKCENAIDEMGLKDLSAEKKAEVLEKMSTLVCDRIILKLMGRISDVEVEKANEIMTGESDEEKLEFLKTKLPDFNIILKEEIDAVKEEILKGI
ncbi:MAG: DUF5663 domain-containing protein [Candidatus Paceibacterota bacterium]|jgi:hypothetical protein